MNTHVLALLLSVFPALGWSSSMLEEYQPPKPPSISSLSVITPRIVGGEETKECLPYQVAIFIYASDGTYFCGGTLISEDFVVTAAHCAEIGISFLVILGAYNISNVNDSNNVMEKVERRNVRIHPKWDSDKLEYDVALLRFNHSVNFTKCIQPIKLPCQQQKRQSLTDKVAKVSGWGLMRDNETTISPLLRAVCVKIIKNSVCSAAFFTILGPSVICTSGVLRKGACSGDSGGPLVICEEKNGNKTLIGIVSFGLGASCELSWPTAFCLVTTVLNWILNVTGIEPRNCSNLESVTCNLNCP